MLEPLRSKTAFILDMFPWLSNTNTRSLFWLLKIPEVGDIFDNNQCPQIISLCIPGIFTAPTDGRYLVTAVLVPQRGEKVEAVLSVSNRIIQTLDSAGFSSEVTAALSPEQCSCSGSTSLSLVVSMKQGDRMGLMLTAGKLAISAPPEMLSSFSAVLLYGSPIKR